MVHHIRKSANVREHHRGGTESGVENHRIDKTTESRHVVVQHVEIHVEVAVVGLHLQALEENPFLRHDGIGLEVLQLKSAEFVGAQPFDIGVNGVAKQIEVVGFQIDAIQNKMCIIHKVLGGLERIRLVLVPKHEIDVSQRNLVNHNRHRLRLFLFLRLVGGEGFSQKGKVHLVLALILDKVGFGVVQFHLGNMDFTLQQIANDNFRPQRANFRQIIIIQVFNRNIIDKDAQIGRHRQASYLDVGTSFFRKITTGKSHRKLLNDRILYGHEQACDEC